MYQVRVGNKRPDKEDDVGGDGGHPCHEAMHTFFRQHNCVFQSITLVARKVYHYLDI